MKRDVPCIYIYIPLTTSLCNSTSDNYIVFPSHITTQTIIVCSDLPIFLILLDAHSSQSFASTVRRVENYPKKIREDTERRVSLFARRFHYPLLGYASVARYASHIIVARKSDGVSKSSRERDSKILSRADRVRVYRRALARATVRYIYKFVCPRAISTTAHVFRLSPHRRRTFVPGLALAHVRR